MSLMCSQPGLCPVTPGLNTFWDNPRPGGQDLILGPLGLIYITEVLHFFRKP